jgi:hypothetical protein
MQTRVTLFAPIYSAFHACSTITVSPMQLKATGPICRLVSRLQSATRPHQKEREGACLFLQQR